MVASRIRPSGAQGSAPRAVRFDQAQEPAWVMASAATAPKRVKPAAWSGSRPGP